MLARIGWCSLTAIAVLGCAADVETSRDRFAAGGLPGSEIGAPGSAGASGAAEPGQPTGPTPGTVSGHDPGAAGAGDDCVGVTEEATSELRPLDVVWAIDTSGSMSVAFPRIQQALKDFASEITAAGIDARIVLLAGAVGEKGGGGLCVPAPVGSGDCGPAATASGPARDSNEPSFLHLDIPFGWHEGMGVILSNHDAYKHMLRPGVLTHIVLTEDGAPPQTAAQVRQTLESGWDPPLLPGQWVFNGVVCMNGPGPGACGGVLFGIGGGVVPTTTLELIQSTGGLVRDLDKAAASGPDNPFTDLLAELAQQVIVAAPVSCDFSIPAPPSGESLDPMRVNVAYLGGAGALEFGRVPDDADCGEQLGWKYDDPATPSRLTLCPAACAEVQADPGARVEIKFGCETRILAPD